MTERLIAIGDIHGCFDQFRTMVEEKIHATKDDRIILIGDLIYAVSTVTGPMQPYGRSGKPTGLQP